MAKLTDQQVKAAKPGVKPYKLYDTDGMFLLVPPNGSKLWRLKYRFGSRENNKPGKAEKVLALGAYPDVSLQMAREKRNAARKLIDDGIDPVAQKKAERAERSAASETFETLATEYLSVKGKALKPGTLKKTRWLLDAWLNPRIGHIPVRELSSANVLSVCRALESKGRHDSAHRARALTSRIMRYARATGRCERDPCADLSAREVLTPVKTKHHAAITEPAKLGQLLRAIDGYEGQPSAAFALRLAPYVFVRPGELRAAQWSEFELDTDKPLWRIPAARMKMGISHIVPLAPQVVKLLEELRPLTGSSRYLFPSLLTDERPISETTLNSGLRRLGFTIEEHTTHGFRTTASTLLNEQNWHPDLIELQLAHKDKDKVRESYNRAEKLTERRRMMLAWADYLDGLKAGGKVIPIRRATKV